MLFDALHVCDPYMLYIFMCVCKRANERERERMCESLSSLKVILLSGRWRAGHPTEKERRAPVRKISTEVMRDLRSHHSVFPTTWNQFKPTSSKPAGRWRHAAQYMTCEKRKEWVSKHTVMRGFCAFWWAPSCNSLLSFGIVVFAWALQVWTCWAPRACLFNPTRQLKLLLLDN